MGHSVFITGSMVVYDTDISLTRQAIECFLAVGLNKHLFLIDNSGDRRYKELDSMENVSYVSSGKNLGFGRGHNSIINEIPAFSTHHLVFNPDVCFEPSSIENLISVLNKSYDSALIAPKVIFPSGQHQFTCRRYPSLLELVIRRVRFLRPLFKKYYLNGIYHDKDLSKLFYADWIHGCFLLFNSSDFKKVNGFDERYFLYMEDIDICRKIDETGKKKLYCPHEVIIHHLNQQSNRNILAFAHHIQSIFQYFYKWGFAK